MDDHSDKQNVVYLYNGILSSPKKEGKSDHNLNISRPSLFKRALWKRMTTFAWLGNVLGVNPARPKTQGSVYRKEYWISSCPIGDQLLFLNEGYIHGSQLSKIKVNQNISGQGLISREQMSHFPPHYPWHQNKPAVFTAWP